LEWSPIPQLTEIGREKRFSEEQIIGLLREAEAGMAVKDLCRKHDFSEASYYLWRSKFGGMTVSEAKRLKELEAENARLKKLLEESMLENEITREALRKSGGRTGARVAGAGDASTQKAKRINVLPLIRCLIGGGGGSRTRVRRRLIPGSTCLAHRWISFADSTAC